MKAYIIGLILMVWGSNEMRGYGVQNITGLAMFIIGAVTILVPTLAPHIKTHRLSKPPKQPHKPKEKKLYCPHCKAEIKDTFNFCTVCGKSLISEGDDMTKMAEKARMQAGMVASIREYTSNEELINCTRYFRNQIENILKRVQDKPELLDSRDIRNLFNLYLPKLAGIVEDFKSMADQGLQPSKRLLMEDDICSVFYKQNMALVSMLDKLTNDSMTDIAAEIDAVEEKLKRDGYETEYKNKAV